MGTAFWLYVLLWALIGGVVGHAIGRSKGRPEAGAAWGALLGVIGWAVIAAGPNLRRKCPECLGVVEDGARKCKNCGSELSGVGTPGQSDSRVDPAPWSPTSGMIPVEEFAASRSIPSEQVIQKIRDGEFVGHIVDDEWFVDLASTVK